MNLEETWKKIVELAREELHIVRKRAEEKTPARDHGMIITRHRPRRSPGSLRVPDSSLHDAEYKQGWRHESAADE